MAARIAGAIRSALFRGEEGPSPAALRAASARDGLSPPPAGRGRTVLALALLIGGNAAASWKSAAPGFAWQFPRDHWAHEGYRTEWWHFIGFAESASGARFAWQLTLFRSGLTLAPTPPSAWAARSGALGHLAVADLDGAERVFSQTSHRESPALARFGTHPDPAIVWMRGPPGTKTPWSVEFADGRFTLRARDRDRGVALELTAVPTRPPLLHGENGFSEKSAGGPGSNYYSQPRLVVAGRITSADRASAARSVAASRPPSRSPRRSSQAQRSSTRASRAPTSRSKEPQRSATAAAATERPSSSAAQPAGSGPPSCPGSRRVSPATAMRRAVGAESTRTRRGGRRARGIGLGPRPLPRSTAPGAGLRGRGARLKSRAGSGR